MSAQDGEDNKGEKRWGIIGREPTSPPLYILDCIETLQNLTRLERREEGEIKAFPPKSAEAKAPNFLFPPHSGRLQNQKVLSGPPCPP